MKTTFRELLLLFIACLPLAVLYYTWTSIPDTIPLHYNASGEPDRYDTKLVLIWFVPLVTLVTYAIFVIVPLIDPKKRVNFGQRSFFAVRLIVGTLITGLMLSYLSGIAGEWNFTGNMPLLLAVFMIFFGNYMPVIKPNYFIGIRTPWTLESEEVWTRTHRFSGKLWVAGGVTGLVMYLVWPSQPLMLTTGLIIAVAVVSVLYSYIVYRKLREGGQPNTERR